MKTQTNPSSCSTPGETPMMVGTLIVVLGLVVLGYHALHTVVDHLVEIVQWRIADVPLFEGRRFGFGIFAVVLGGAIAAIGGGIQLARESRDQARS